MNHPATSDGPTTGVGGVDAGVPDLVFGTGDRVRSVQRSGGEDGRASLTCSEGHISLSRLSPGSGNPSSLVPGTSPR